MRVLVFFYNNIQTSHFHRLSCFYCGCYCSFQSRTLAPRAGMQHTFLGVLCQQSAAWRRCSTPPPRPCGTILHPLPTTSTHSNLIPETSGPDKPANEAFPAALSVCLPPAGASNRQCRSAADRLGGRSHRQITVPLCPVVCQLRSSENPFGANQKRRTVYAAEMRFPFFSNQDREMRRDAEN